MRVMVFKALSKKFQLYRDGLDYWWREPEYLVKTTDLAQITDKVYHIINECAFLYVLINDS